MEGHPDQAELKPSGGTLTLDGTETTEDDLLDMITSLEARLGDVRELHQEQQSLEVELDDLHADLDARAAELEQREQILNESSTEMHSERAAVEAERRALTDQQAEVQRRRDELEAKEREAGERLHNVDEMQAKLEAAEAALRTERKRREAEAETFRREQEDLVRREAELAAHAAEQGKDTPEITALAAQLAEAQKLATQRAADAEKRAAEAQQRTLELESRCKDLAGECGLVRKALQGSREQIQRVEQELPQRIYKQQLREQRTLVAQRTVVTAMTWICVAVTMGAAGLAGVNGAIGEASLMLGFAFAAFFFGSQAIAGRLFDAPAIAIGLIGASFGWWFPMWSAAVAQALETWAIPTGPLPAAIIAQLPIGVAVATAGLTLSIGLFALTWSGKLLVQVGFVSVLAGGLALFPDDSGFAISAAAVIWIAVTGAGLTRWAVRVASKAAPVTTAVPQVSQVSVAPGRPV
ncbi:hypothetical protein MNBD_PLANCTO03-820 [hydrothermal vent metagenome]|uniref:Uncharacterized protein n=1 Tax=hydrothermal vent metagenome TaxID=652676 RepID=A0A3B1E674_9ZZZZ